MKLKSENAKDELTRRLRRIEGQVQGVQRMVAEDRDCREILQQLSAIRSAVQGVSRVFLQEYATQCLVEMDEVEPAVAKAEIRLKREKVVQDMIALLDKAP